MEAKVLEVLRTVKDPDLGKDLVSLNMIRDLTVSANQISLRVMLTTPACPLKDQIKHDVETALFKAFGNHITLSVIMDADSSRFQRSDALLPEVSHVILVSSGKGGVGKSTVAANLAVSLANSGASVGLLDADIHGPSQPILMGLQDTKPAMEERNGKQLIVPVLKHGVHTLSIGMLIPDSQAVVWRGPMVSSALRQLLTDVSWGKLDYLVIDLPPGTGDVHLTVAQLVQVAGALVVTTPQSVAVADARKGAAMFNMPQINIPILGIVENMAWFEPEDMPGKKYYVFGSGGASKLAQEFNVPVLGQIPMVAKLASSSDYGVPACINEPIITLAFKNLAGEVARKLVQQSEIGKA